MDTFDNQEIPGEEETPVPQEQTEISEPQAATPEEARTEVREEPPVQSQSAPPQYAPPQQPHSEGSGKQSPYASSPYMMSGQAYQGYQYQYQPQTQPPQKKEKKRVSTGTWKWIAAAVCVVMLVAVGCCITAAVVEARCSQSSDNMVSALNEKIDDLQAQLDRTSPASGNFAAIPTDGSALTPSQIYSASVNSVVAITSTVQNSYYGGGTSSGSGFILTEDGYVVTNYHVVEGASRVDVVLHNGTEYTAQVVGFDTANDLAVLKVDGENLPAAVIGSSDALNIGDMVVAIGNPLGELTATQTVGYVSGIGREVTTDSTIISMIQTDAAINPGNSGGPLFNMYGQVVGITTAKYSGTTSSGASIEGIGFAIPIDDVRGMISDLMSYGYVTGAYLGVTVTNTDAESAAMFSLPTGAYVMEVVPGASAHRAGIQVKDIIIKLGTHRVSSMTELTRALRNFKAGDSTTITVIRGGKEVVMDITLDEKPHDTAPELPEDELDVPENGDFDEWYEFFRRYFG